MHESELVGNIHIHSQYSDGRGSIREIAAAAQKAGLDFIIITDHNTLEALHRGEEGYYGNVLALIGTEVNEGENHYLALGVGQEISMNEENPQEIIDEVNRQEGWGAMAHPCEKGSPLYQKGRTYNWTDWSVKGFQAIEIWNYLSQWKDAIRSIPQGIFHVLFPHAAFRKGAFSEVLEIWDQRLRDGERIFASGGSDAHDIRIHVLGIPITIGSYGLSFRCINLHLLLTDPLTGKIPEDKKSILEALYRGSYWVSYDYYKSSQGFSFTMAAPNGRAVTGERIAVHPQLKARIKTPSKATVYLIKDGQRYSVSRAKKMHIFTDLQPGVYRVEVWHRVRGFPRAWIYSNPIWVSE